MATSADFQTRIDRKYLIRPDMFTRLVTSISRDVSVLEIDEARQFRYESVYFDTPERASYLASAHGRRRRFKVRTRTYVDSGSCVLEVKTTGGRGETVKTRWLYGMDDRATLTRDAQAVIDRTVGLPGVSDRLAPALTTSYHRSTLLALDGGYRLTVDTDLVCAAPGGAFVCMDDKVLVETKARSTATVADRILWAAGHRPVRISKYCVGMAALDRDLPANKWHRTLRHHLGLR